MVFFKNCVIHLITILVLDYFWLGLVANKFFRNLLNPIARINEGKIDVHYPSAVVVYLLMALATEIFVFQNNNAVNLKNAMLLGAFLGLVIYGVYDFTNYAILKNYPSKMLVVDVLWGGFLLMVVSAVGFKLR